MNGYGMKILMAKYKTFIDSTVEYCTAGNFQRETIKVLIF